MTTTAQVTFDSYKDFKGYVINLDREHWRYDEAQCKLTELGFSNVVRWEATDYNREDVNTEVRRMGAKRLERFVNDAEIALVLSHYRVWANFLSGKEQYCLVFEDDVVGVPNFAAVADFNDLSYGDFDLLCFGGIFLDITDSSGSRSYTDLATVCNQQGDKSYVSNASFWQSHAYLISREGAYKLMAGYPIWMSLEESRQPQVDNYISNYRVPRTVLAVNRELGDPKGYSLSWQIHPEYGDLSKRVCGILLQEKSFKSTIFNV